MTKKLSFLDESIRLAVLRGRVDERERVTKLWEQEMACECEDAMNHLIALIKGEK